ncbi:hypothetical protein QYE76_039799 [Lolium multiflorum]|uniref:Uncharacterized protein n=1 Tax=Lolium multiflorum TaxID=4521 RepID=A0AAD8TAJ1_LOLMU|nr:hypothetical protein QYE76_039799 [Lolium multiflorum]
MLLTRENALIWKSLVILALRDARVLDLVEGSEVEPEKLPETKDVNKKKVTIENSSIHGSLVISRCSVGSEVEPKLLETKDVNKKKVTIENSSIHGSLVISRCSVGSSMRSP